MNIHVSRFIHGCFFFPQCIAIVCHFPDVFSVIYQLLGSNGDSDVRKRRRRRQTQDFLQPYIAAKMENLPETFVLGDEKTYNGFFNKALPGQQQYRTFILAALKDRESVSLTHTHSVCFTKLVRTLHRLPLIFILG